MRKNIRAALIIFFLLFFSAAASAADVKEEEAFFVAQKAYSDGFYDVSQQLLDRFLASYPSSEHAPQVNLMIGQCLFHQGKYLEALTKFQSLESLPAASKIRDEVIYWIAEVHFRGNDFAKAASFYRKIVEDFHNSSFLPAATYSLGWCLFQEGSYKDALAFFRTVEEKFPKEAVAQDSVFKIIECLYHLKDYPALKEKAASYLKAYAKDNAKSAYLYFYLAEAQYYMNDFGEAIASYTKVLSGTRDERILALSRLGIAWSHLKLKHYKDATLAFAEIKPEGLEKNSREALLLGKAILAGSTGKPDEAQNFYEDLLLSTSDPIVSAQAYLGKADILYSRGDYSDAIKVYKEAFVKIPADSPREILDKLHYGLAWVFLKEGQFKEAIDEFQKIAKNTEDKIIKVATLCQIGDAYQESGDYAKAAESYDRILKDYPDSFYGDYVQYQLGLTMLKSGNYPGAILALQTLKSNFPSSKLLDEASYALGMSYFQRADYKSAREVFEKFSQEYKESPLKSQAQYLLGTSLFNLGDFSGAIEAFKALVRDYPQDTEFVQKAEYEIADCFSQMGNEKEAIARFKSLKEKYPTSTLTPEVIWWLGDYYYRHNDLDAAKEYFSSLIRDFPGTSLLPDAHFALGSICKEETRYQEAIENFRKVGQLTKSDLAATAGIAIADIYVRQNQTDIAIKTYKEIASDYPNLAHLVYPKIGDAYRKAGKPDEAIGYYRKALDVVGVTEMPEMQFKIAEAFESKGQADAAVENYLKVTYLYPQAKELCVKSLLRVGTLYENRENYAEAAKIYEKIAELSVEESKYARERIDWINANAKRPTK